MDGDNVIHVNFKKQENPMSIELDKFTSNLQDNKVYGALFIQEDHEGNISLAYMKSEDEDIRYIVELLQDAITMLFALHSGELSDEDKGSTT